ncbi:MAG: hypothetical protein LBQ47_08560, partial [Endomicrobium sp.]|nr:hypothetical protein [Endomicrobium sp.]
MFTKKLFLHPIETFGRRLLKKKGNKMNLFLRENWRFLVFAAAGLLLICLAFLASNFTFGFFEIFFTLAALCAASISLFLSGSRKYPDFNKHFKVLIKCSAAVLAVILIEIFCFNVKTFTCWPPPGGRGGGVGGGWIFAVVGDY